MCQHLGLPLAEAGYSADIEKNRVPCLGATVFVLCAGEFFYITNGVNHLGSIYLTNDSTGFVFIIYE